MTRIIAVCSQKGGVAKTTTTANLGAILAYKHRVLLVDWDPQSSLGYTLGVSPDPTAYRVLRAYAEGGAAGYLPTVTPASTARLRIVPSHLDLALAEVELLHADRREYLLTDLLAPLLRTFDFVLIDCPPSLGVLTINALTAATEVLVPVVPEYLAVQGLSRLTQTIDRVQRRLNPRLRVAGIIPVRLKYYGKSLAQEHKAYLEQITQIAERAGVPLLPDVPELVAVPEAAGQGLPLTEYAADSPATQAYWAIANSLLKEPPHGN